MSSGGTSTFNYSDTKFRQVQSKLIEKKKQYYFLSEDFDKKKIEENAELDDMAEGNGQITQWLSGRTSGQRSANIRDKYQRIKSEKSRNDASSRYSNKSPMLKSVTSDVSEGIAATNRQVNRIDLSQVDEFDEKRESVIGPGSQFSKKFNEDQKKALILQREKR